jgi:hypothetical protein
MFMLLALRVIQNGALAASTVLIHVFKMLNPKAALGMADVCWRKQ